MLSAATSSGAIACSVPTRNPAIAWDIRPHNGAPSKAIYESGAMLMGVDPFAVGAKDERTPHKQDAIYSVESGQTILDAGTQRSPCGRARLR